MLTNIETDYLDIYREETLLRQQGYKHIAGIDEVGRGPLAGPVVAAAVILPEEFYIPDIRDSKKTSQKNRTQWSQEIKQEAIAWSVARVEPEQIDLINILQATLLAMDLAWRGLSVRPDYLLVDGKNKVSQQEIPQLALVKGDNRSVSIMAAAIIAKVHRDAVMEEYHDQYPEYGFAKHKGYGTRAHFSALHQHGPCTIHRNSFLRNI